MAKKRNKFAKLKPGDAVELIWHDATTVAKWTASNEVAKITLYPILTRGTLLEVRDDAILVALDVALKPDGTFDDDYHGIGVVEINSVVEIHKLRRTR